jgi:hypothetical protein
VLRFIEPAWIDHTVTASSSGQLVRDELSGGAQRAEQRVLVRARPPGHEHADHREARHRERVEHADVEVFTTRSGPIGITRNTRNVEITTDDGRSGEHTLVGLPRHDVLLLEELHAVAHELEPAVEAAGVHRTEPALHVAHHLQQEDVTEDERAQRDDQQGRRSS